MLFARCQDFGGPQKFHLEIHEASQHRQRQHRSPQRPRSPHEACKSTTAAMHLMYIVDPQDPSKRVYTLKKVIDGKVSKSAHPARFSPDDKYSRHRVTIKKRYGLLLTQQSKSQFFVCDRKDLDGRKTGRSRALQAKCRPNWTLGHKESSALTRRQRTRSPSATKLLHTKYANEQHQATHTFRSIYAVI